MNVDIDAETREEHDRHLEVLREHVMRDGVFASFNGERENQLAKWGPQTHPDGTSGVLYSRQRDAYRDLCDARAANGHGTWLDILLEEVFEAAAESGEPALEKELVQVGAVVTAWLEDIRSRG